MSQKVQSFIQVSTGLDYLWNALEDHSCPVDEEEQLLSGVTKDLPPSWCLEVLQNAQAVGQDNCVCPKSLCFRVCAARTMVRALAL